VLEEADPEVLDDVVDFAPEVSGSVIGDHVLDIVGVRLMKLFKSGFVTIQEAQDQFFVVLNVHAFSGVR
jgi:hypothetical protein